MKIAAITIFCNESFRIKKWLEYYKEYKDELFLHIIIDNASYSKESEKVKEAFPNSKYIKLNYNGGVTAAYNVGVRVALDNSSIDAIMLICNDIKITQNSIKYLKNILETRDVDMVTPVLLKKDTDIIEDGGDTISYCLFMNPCYVGKKYSEIIEKDKYVLSVTGGMNLATRKFYEIIGPQDENLFMYSDEIDIGLKAKRNNLKMMMVWKSVAWHQHENSVGGMERDPVSEYLMARNKIYLAKKYFGRIRQFIIFNYYLWMNIKRFIKRTPLIVIKYSIRGIIDGYKMAMGKPRIKEEVKSD